MKTPSRYAVRTGTEKGGFEFFFHDCLPAAMDFWQSFIAKDHPALIDLKTGRIIKQKG